MHKDISGMVEHIIKPFKGKGPPLTSAGFGYDSEIAELEDLWSGESRQPERNSAVQLITASQEASCSLSLCLCYQDPT